MKQQRQQVTRQIERHRIEGGMNIQESNNKESITGEKNLRNLSNVETTMIEKTTVTQQLNRKGEEKQKRQRP